MRIRLRDAQLTLATVGLERYAKTTRLDRLWSTSIQVTKVQNVTIGREITKEKERIGEALARVDAQRESSPVSSTNWRRPSGCWRATAKARGQQGRRSASTRATRADAPARERGRRCTTTAGPAAGERTSPLGDQILALATGKTQKEIAAACNGACPNHVGVVIARHERAGRIEERDGKLYATQSAGTEQRAAV